MKEYKRRYRVNNDTRANAMEISVYYALGGTNVFTGMVEKRGYYFAFTPVTIEKRDYGSLVSMTAFTGVKVLAVPAKRNTEKQFLHAKGMFDQLLEKYKGYVSSYDIDFSAYEEQEK